MCDTVRLGVGTSYGRPAPGYAAGVGTVDQTMPALFAAPDSASEVFTPLELLRQARIAPEEAYEKAIDKKKFRAFLRTPPDDFDE